MAAQQLYSGLRRLALAALALVISFGLTACGGAKAKAPTLSADDITVIERQAEGFLSARNRLPELATLVNERNWVFTRNLIHGPMQEVGREMLYICLLYTSPSPRDRQKSRMPSSA